LIDRLISSRFNVPLDTKLVILGPRALHTGISLTHVHVRDAVGGDAVRECSLIGAGAAR